MPVSNDLKRNMVPSWVNEIILVNILPTNSNPEDTIGAFRMSSANRIWTPIPFKTNFQSIPFLFLLNKKAISKREIIPKIPLKSEVMENSEMAIALVTAVLIAFGGEYMWLGIVIGLILSYVLVDDDGINNGWFCFRD